jgi:hypothetical protein
MAPIQEKPKKSIEFPIPTLFKLTVINVKAPRLTALASGHPKGVKFLLRHYPGLLRRAWALLSRPKGLFFFRLSTCM